MNAWHEAQLPFCGSANRRSPSISSSVSAAAPCNDASNFEENGANSTVRSKAAMAPEGATGAPADTLDEDQDRGEGDPASD